jgi:hypothetical protein
MHRWLRRLSLISVAILIWVTLPEAHAQSRFIKDLVAHLNEYKASGLLADEELWFSSKLTDPLDNKVSRYVLQEILRQCLQRLRSKSIVRYIRINEQHNPSDLNIFIIDPNKDPRGIIERVHARGNAVSFPNSRLILIDVQLLDSIVGADFSVSTDSPTTDFRLSRTVEGQTALSLQLLNSVAGIKAAALMLTGDVGQAFYKIKTYTGFVILLHEIGHVYHQHNLNSASYFRPGKEAENIEVEADNFALSILDSLGYTQVGDVIFTQVQMGVAATLSYYLRKTRGHGISEYFYKVDKDNKPLNLVLTYRLLDLHPPLEYRLLLISATMQNRSSPSVTNPYREILSTLGWTWSLL